MWLWEMLLKLGMLYLQVHRFILVPQHVINIMLCMPFTALVANVFIRKLQVRKITFTGSTAVGKKLMAGAASTVKKVSLLSIL